MPEDDDDEPAIHWDDHSPGADDGAADGDEDSGPDSPLAGNERVGDQASDPDDEETDPLSALADIEVGGEYDGDDPFGELADAETGDADQEMIDELFETGLSETETEAVDPEAVWAELESEEGEPVFVADEDSESAGPPGSDVREIPNRICHSCRFFGEPPDLHCTHDGTEIREAVDFDHYEVVDCPMVVDRDDLSVPGEED
ncbi:MAG: hypothetical protein ABEJ08_02715 [Halobacteriaceae archaeon]